MQQQQQQPETITIIIKLIHIALINWKFHSKNVRLMESGL